jgi:hypothetical protein
MKCDYGILRFANYIEGDALFTCSSCIEGYSLDISSKSCVCDTISGFKQFSDTPIKCDYNVLGSAYYIEVDTQFTCSSCIEGYTYDILAKSCILKRAELSKNTITRIDPE